MHAPEPRQRSSAFWALVAAYLALNLIGRWLAWTLFHGHGVYGWARPGALEITLVVLSTALPAGLVAWSLHALLQALPEKLPNSLERKVVAPTRRELAALGVAFLVLCLLEADMAWVQLSQSHLGWRDVHMFATESWSEHFGLRPADFIRHGLLALIHAVVLGLMWLASRLAFVTRIRRLPTAFTGALLAGLTLFDAAAVSWHISQSGSDATQWTELREKHPLRSEFLDALGDRLFDANSDLLEARAALLATAPAGPTANRRLTDGPNSSAEIRDVLLIVIESLSSQHCDERSMPELHALAERGLRLQRHYSVGNCTHYGILGLLFGDPVTFYRGVEKDDLPQSPFIDALDAHGFESRYLGSDLTSFRHVGKYMRNFSRPDYRGAGQELVEATHAELATPGRHFTMLFYGDTHYPYPHSEEYSEFQPEVPADFDYSAWDVRESTPAILNRYRNALQQCDAWLGRVLAEVDLESTLVVITGDHGQEFFENGRLAHGSALDEPQLRTPCILLAPGLEPGTVSRISSHADLMPTIFELLGLPAIETRFGQTIFGAEGRHAVAAHNEHTRAPLSWAVITDEGKSQLRKAPTNLLVLEALSDHRDHSVSFRENPDRWQRNFALVRRLESVLVGVTY